MFRFLLLPLIIALPVDDEPLPQSREGVWQGAGVQIDGQDWPMTVTIMPDRSLVDYPSLGCGGHWDYLNFDAFQITAVERITYGVDQCLDGGLIQVSVYDEHSLYYQWFDKSGKVVAGVILIEGELRMDNYDALLALTMQAVGNYFVEGPTAQIDMDNGEL